MEIEDSKEKILADWNAYWTVGEEKVRLMMFDSFDKLYKHLRWNSKRQGGPDRLRFHTEQNEMFMGIGKDQGYDAKSKFIIDFFKDRKEMNRKHTATELEFWTRVKTMKNDGSRS